MTPKESQPFVVSSKNNVEYLLNITFKDMLDNIGSVCCTAPLRKFLSALYKYFIIIIITTIINGIGLFECYNPCHLFVNRVRLHVQFDLLVKRYNVMLINNYLLVLQHSHTLYS